MFCAVCERVCLYSALKIALPLSPRLLLSLRANLELAPFHWPVKATSHSLPPCTEYFDEAFIFTLDLSSSADERYFRLHTATFIPLYSLMMWRRHFGPVTPPGYRVLLMPAAEKFSVKARPSGKFLMG